MASTALFEGIMRVLGAPNVEGRDPILFFLLILTAVSIIIALSALRASAQRKNSGGDIARLRDKLDELALMVDDVSGRSHNSRIRIDKRTLYLEEKIKTLEKLEKTVAELSRTAQTQLDSATSYLDDRVNALESEVEDIKERGVKIAEDQDVGLAMATPEPEAPPSLLLQLEDSAPTVIDEDISLPTALRRARVSFLAKINSLLSQQEELGEAVFYRGLQDLLASEGFGNAASSSLLWKVKESLQDTNEESGPKSLHTALENSVRELLETKGSLEIIPQKVAGQPKVVLIVGAPDSGKTSVCGHLAARFRAQGAKVLATSADSGRFNSGIRIETWAERYGVDVLSEPSSVKPKTIAYKALHRAQDEDYDVVLIDTIGSFQSDGDSNAELFDVISMIAREQPSAPHEIILSVDAAIGQSVIEQRMQFEEKFKISGVAVSKLDRSKSVGNLVGIKAALGVPVRFITYGEGGGGFDVFNSSEFIYSIFHEPAAAASLSNDDLSTAPL